MSLGGWIEAGPTQYGLNSVDGFCQGWGQLDQLGDVASQIMSDKYPKLGSTRVSKAEAMTEHFVDTVTSFKPL